MRIDSHSYITGENKPDVSNLLSGLETGDVIKAKVLEMSPQEAVLRLSDGSVIKARLSESIDAKQGQTISLSVTSRTDNSFVLETVKDALQTVVTDTGKLQKILDAVSIKSDDINLKLAAEFLKYGIKPTSESISKALEHMKEPSGLDAEKAVFLAVKNITADKIDKDMLVQLLNGNLKLGRLLETLHNAVNGQTNDVETQNARMQNIEVSASNPETLPAADNKTPPKTPSAPVSNSRIDAKIDADAKLPIPVSSDTVSNASASESAQAQANENASSARSVTVNETQQTAATGAGIKQLDATAVSITAEAVPDTINKPRADPQKAVSNDSASEHHNISASDTGMASANKSTDPDNQDISIKASVIKNIVHGSIDEKQAAVDSIEKATEKVIASIDKLYVKINKQLSADELDPVNIKERLTELSDELNKLVRLSGSSQAANTQAVSAANLIDDAAKLLDIFNANNVLYYQIPVKLENFSSTAELYVMKRQQNKKRIDPHDSVLFLSLDTKNMGRIETILDVKGSNVTISLRSESQAVNDFTRANIKSLYSGLSECGYKLVDIRYSIIGSAAFPAEQEKLLTDAIRLKHGKVDLKI